MALAAVSSETAEAAAETALTAEVSSAIVVKVTAGLSRVLCGFSSAHELEMLLLLGGGELFILLFCVVTSLNGRHPVNFFLGYAAIGTAT